MRFDGRVWFDFTNPAVWEFYRFVRALAESDNAVNLEWVPLFKGTEEEAMTTFISLASPQDRGRFLHAMLGLVHIDNLDAEEPATVERALEAADVDASERVEVESLHDLAANATEIGVTETPTLYDGGPVMHIVLNGAANVGDVAGTAESILGVLNSDGIWKLSKP